MCADRRTGDKFIADGGTTGITAGTGRTFRAVCADAGVTWWSTTGTGRTTANTGFPSTVTHGHHIYYRRGADHSDYRKRATAGVHHPYAGRHVHTFDS